MEYFSHSLTHPPTQLIALSKSDLFTHYPANCLSQHHQGKHCRRGGIGEESRAEDRELLPAGCGAPHWEGGHSFFSAVIKTHQEQREQKCIFQIKSHKVMPVSSNGTWRLINLIHISEAGEDTPEMQGKYVNTHTEFGSFLISTWLLAYSESHIHVKCCHLTWISIFVYLKSAFSLNMLKLPEDVNQLCSFCLLFVLS